MVCGEKQTMPYTCNHCGESLCSEHRLPEAHRCAGLRRVRRTKRKSMFGDYANAIDEDVADDDLKSQSGADDPSNADESGGPEPVDIDELPRRPSSASDRAPTSPPVTLRSNPHKERTSEPDSPSVRDRVAGALSRVTRLRKPSVAQYRWRRRKRRFVRQVRGTIRLTLFVALIGVVVLAGAVGLGVVAPSEDVQTGIDSVLASDSTNWTEVEVLVIKYTNEERVERGLQPVDRDTELGAIASYHSEDMATKGYFAHDSPTGETVGDRYAQFGYGCQVPTGGGYYATGSENIAQTWLHENVQTDSGSEYYSSENELARGLVMQWMNSPPHRENILTDHWRNLGVGVHIVDDKVYATQNFC